MVSGPAAAAGFSSTRSGRIAKDGEAIADG
jgi:hypothetical protein